MSTHDNNGHSPLVLSSCPESSHHEDCNRYWDCCKCQAELRIGYIINHYNYKLDSETQKEEEVEFEKGDVNLRYHKHFIMKDYLRD